MNDSQDRWKQAAAAAALSLVCDGMVVGLGSGTTAERMVAALGERVRTGLRVHGVATSRRIETIATAAGVPLVSPDDVDTIDLTIDGADEIVLATFDVIKGRGGALLREKLVARASTMEVIAVDGTKLVDRLGRRSAVPVEVVPFAWRHTVAALGALGARVERRPADPCCPQGAPFLTDNGNLIVDCRFPSIADPADLERRIKLVPGVVESGLFVGLIHRVVVADDDGVRIVDHPTGAR